MGRDARQTQAASRLLVRRTIPCTLVGLVALGIVLVLAAMASATSYDVRETPIYLGGAVAVGGLHDVTGVSAGGGCPDLNAACGDFNLALLSDRTVMAWGYGGGGQLGDGSLESSGTPVPVNGLGDVKAIAAGWSHSLALRADGAVEAWGYGGNGGLGQGAFSSSDVPVAVSGLSGAVAVAAGAGDSLALLTDGTVKAWGYNAWGQLGDGTFENRDVPVAVGGLSNVVAVAAGRYFSLALLSNGKVMGWGYDANGELGNFTGPCETWPGCPAPVQVGELDEVSAVSAGLAHSLVLIDNGQVDAWGANGEGQLGNHTIGEKHFRGSTKPVTVTGLSGAAAVAAGSHASLALTDGGSVMGWGFGSDVATEVAAFKGAIGIAAGGAQSLAYGPFANVTGVAPTTGSSAGGTVVSISGNDLTGATAVKFGSVDATSFTVNSETSITAIAPPHITGSVDVAVTTPLDTSLTGPADHFSYLSPPVIAKILPKSGPAGTTVTISGKYFDGATTVDFGSVAAAGFTVNSPTSIVAVAPAEAAGKVDVTVSTQYGPNVASAKDRFEVTPTVTGVSPNTGSVAGGSSVTVSGSGFAPGAGATQVKFGNKTAHSVSCPSTAECIVIAPAHPAGAVDVTVRAGKARSSPGPADQFTYG
jgi:Regulator of chromosome condensation (RCC1) repeat/IPT/TIG domain